MEMATISSDEERGHEKEANEGGIQIANEVDLGMTLDDSGIVDEPKEGMIFSSEKDVQHYYTEYARCKGFSVFRRSTRLGDDGTLRWLTLACARSGKYRSIAKNPLKPPPSTKTGCLARVHIAFGPDGSCRLSKVVLEHNHGFGPVKARHFRSNTRLDSRVKRRLEQDDQAGININRNFNSFLVEAGGYANLTVGKKDRQNYIKKARRLRLGNGDSEALRKYFRRMQENNSSFFYEMDFDADNHLRNVFWADARSRATYEAFGDVVTFDTTYLTNKYDMPFALFVGANHHGQSVLLGCALLSSEDIETFVWLFETWLACMSGHHPNAIITDQCKAMRRAIQLVFPNTRHRWCLWHIMKKIPEKLRGYAQYESIKFDLQNVVYDSLIECEFEESWSRVIQKYNLHNNEWLRWLYDERHHWVPSYVKDTFWAGMSTTQRSESMHTFFDDYLNSKTTLKQFVEQYDNALRSKFEKETNADFDSFNSLIPCTTEYDIEKQFQKAYTTAKFKEVQDEFMGKMYCYSSLVMEEGLISTYKVREDVKIGEKLKHLFFNVYFNKVECEVQCVCRLFESRGILCRHVLTLLTQEGVHKVPEKYILARWRKDLKRRYTYIKSTYDDLSSKPHVLNYKMMCNSFSEVADLTCDSSENVRLVISAICELKEKVHQNKAICGSNQLSLQDHSIALSNYIVDNEASKDSNKELSLVAVRSEGHPSLKQKEPKVDQAARKSRERKKNQKVDENQAMKQKQKKVDPMIITGNENEQVDYDGSDAHPPNLNLAHLVNEFGTQESINLMESPSTVVGGGYMRSDFTYHSLSANQLQDQSSQHWRGGYVMGNFLHHDFNGNQPQANPASYMGITDDCQRFQLQQHFK